MNKVELEQVYQKFERDSAREKSLYSRCLERAVEWISLMKVQDGCNQQILLHREIASDLFKECLNCDSPSIDTLKIFNRYDIEYLDLSGLFYVNDSWITTLLITNSCQLSTLASHLHSLNLEETSITDFSIVCIGKCSNLKSLNMSYCINITSQGLEELSNMNQLESLSLVSCPGITNIRFLRDLHNLRYLDIRYCYNIKDRNVVEYMLLALNLKCLKAMHTSSQGVNVDFKYLPLKKIEYLMISGIFADEGFRLSLPSNHLVSLSLDSVDTVQINLYQMCQSFPCLEHLSIQFGKTAFVARNEPPEMLEWTSLKSLRVTGTSRYSYFRFVKYPNLQELTLNNYIFLLGDQLDFPKLFKLDISKSGSTHWCLKYLLDRGTSLKYLNLSDIDIAAAHSIIGRIGRFFQVMSDLEYLNLNRFNLLNGGIELISHLEKLEELHIDNSWVDDTEFQKLFKLRNLRVLHCFSGHISEQSIQVLYNFVFLENLKLCGTMLNDECCRVIGSMKNLAKVDISRNPMITDQGILELKSLRRLRYLNISECSISSTVFQYFAQKRFIPVLHANRCPLISETDFESYTIDSTLVQNIPAEPFINYGPRVYTDFGHYNLVFPSS